MHLKLSDTPPEQWAEAFGQEWRLRLYSRKRRARVDGDYAVLHCPLDEIESDHKQELLAVIEQVNQWYKDHVVRQALRVKHALERRAVAEQRKKDALGRVEFD